LAFAAACLALPISSATCRRRTSGGTLPRVRSCSTRWI